MPFPQVSDSVLETEPYRSIVQRAAALQVLNARGMDGFSGAGGAGEDLSTAGGSSSTKNLSTAGAGGSSSTENLSGAFTGGVFPEIEALLEDKFSIKKAPTAESSLLRYKNNLQAYNDVDIAHVYDLQGDDLLLMLDSFPVLKDKNPQFVSLLSDAIEKKNKG